MNITLEKLALQGYRDPFGDVASFRGKLVSLRKQYIREIMSDYIQVEKRLEYIASVCGIDFINDANACSFNASWYSLENMHKPVIWIVNNVASASTFDRLIPLIHSKVKAVIVLSQEILRRSAFSDHVERVYQMEQIEDAVSLAYTIGKSGDAVLFSPANSNKLCFFNENQKIDRFVQAVKNL
jgi:UDP-N-acetylmuramoylalanine--D-glutamate ligase